MHLTRHTLLLSQLLLLPHLTSAILPDGLLVPFTSLLPACASLCGPLSDVQGGCVPPVKTGVDQKCFCSDSRLSTFVQGPNAVAAVCGSDTGCTSEQLGSVEGWYAKFCGVKAQGGSSGSGSGSGSANSNGNAVANGAQGSTEVTGGTTAASSSSSHKQPQGGSWISTHWKWLIMLVLVFGGLAVIALVGRFFRKRYLRKQDFARNMRGPNAPTAIKPANIQPATMMQPAVQPAYVGTRDFAAIEKGGMSEKVSRR